MSTADQAIANEQDYILQTYPRPPFVLERGEGVYLYDTEGRRYLDYVQSYGASILGHIRSFVPVLLGISDMGNLLIRGHRRRGRLLRHAVAEIDEIEGRARPEDQEGQGGAQDTQPGNKSNPQRYAADRRRQHRPVGQVSEVDRLDEPRRVNGAGSVDHQSQ